MDADRQALLSVLLDHQVHFVLIGGAAIQSHGRGYDTKDVDVVPDMAPENLARLARALNSLDCRLITDPADAQAWVPLPDEYFTEHTLRRAAIWNLATRHGQLDLTFTPDGFPGGYPEFARRARTGTVADTDIAVSIAALEDIHRSKREANRPKDQRYFQDFEDRPGR